MQRLQEEEQKDHERKIEDNNRLLEDGAREDVRQYVKRCKERRRLSLAFRVKEHREHLRVQRRLKEKALEARHEDSTFHSLDQKYVALAKEKERAKAAINHLQHLSQGCTFSRNPFASLLD